MEKIVSQTALDNSYHSKEIVSNACSEIFENILKKTYDEENPFKGEYISPLIDKLSCDGSNFSTISSDFAIIPKRSFSTKVFESKTYLETDSFKTAKSKYTTCTGVTQIHYLNQKTTNPFETLLTANESFTYHKPHYSRLSRSTIIEEEETDNEYDELEGLSISAERLRNGVENNEIANESVVQKNENYGAISDFLSGNFEQEVSIPNNLLVKAQTDDESTAATCNLQGQGDSNTVNEHPLFDTTCASVSISINFAFYAKLLAFLLTINTLIFFKTFVFANVLNFWIR